MKKLSLVLILILLLSACAPAGSGDNTEELKLVSLAPSLTEIVFAIDLGDQLVGRTDFCEYPAEVANIESIGTMYEPDIEKIIALEPTHVLSVVPNEDLNKQLEDAGIKSINVPQVATVEETYGMIEKLAEEFGKGEAAKQVTDEMRSKIDAVKTAVADANPVSVYYVVGFGDDGDYTATGDTFIHDMLQLAGGDNIAKDGSDWSYSLESLLAADPEIILISNQWDMKANFIAAENYKELQAVKNDKVYEIETDLLELQGPRVAQGVETIAKILHPDLVK